MAKTPLFYQDIYLGEEPLSAIYWGKDKIWKVPYITTVRPQPIMVYAPETRTFTRNGFCALQPISAIHELTFGQAGEITVVHPIDRAGNWKSLTPNNILLTPLTWHGESKPQAFRIYRTVKQMDTDGKLTITVYARHVFYDLNHSLLENLRFYLPPSGTVGQIFAQQMGAQGTPGSLDAPYFYNLASDAWYDREDHTVRNYRISPASIRRDTAFQDTSIADALIGSSGSVAQTWGLEFYVDNFYFSLLSVMEYSLQNSFHIRYGYDMMGVTEEIDYTSAFTHLFCSDNFGDFAATSIGEQAWGPYVRPKKAAFSYEYAYPDAADNLKRLVQDETAYWESSRDPAVTYTASYAPLAQDKSRDFIGQLDGREVGDTGTIVNEPLGISTQQRIIYKKTDVLTGIALDIRLGNVPAYLTQRGAWSNIIRSGAPSAVEKQIAAMQT